MGNNNSATYTVKYPEGFNEKHTEIDHGLSYFKNDLEAAQRAGRGPSGIKERASNRKKLKGYEMGINAMVRIRSLCIKLRVVQSLSPVTWCFLNAGLFEKLLSFRNSREAVNRGNSHSSCSIVPALPSRSIVVFQAKQRTDIMSKKSTYKEEDFTRWQEMIDQLTALYKDCKNLLENSTRRSAKKKTEEGTTADDFLRGDGGGKKATGKQERESGNYRTGKMSEQERQAMKEINDKEEVMDDLADQITENLEFLQIKAEMIGEEIESQKDLVEEVNARAHNTKNRTKKLNKNIERTMEADGMQKAEQKKKENSKDLKTKIMSNMLKGAIS